ncbi:MAG: hypothetical protein JWM57_493 [Phycisphaerales bacterium]|nr:hypothetical protein [Phycisphaerales bacterium]
MTETESKSSPALAKQLHIAESIRKEITDGVLTPGDRLPTQLQLVERFRVSGVTVQRAVDRLIRDGFIVTRGRNGTFVSSHPPHLFSYGVVFRDAPRVGRSRYHELLERHAVRLQRSGDRRVRIFQGINGREDTPDSAELLQLVRAHQMAGLILVDGDALVNTPLLDEQGIFRVAVMSRKVETLQCPIVYPDMTGMIDTALDLLVARGRRRVATLISVPQQQEVGHYLRHAMVARGLDVYERWHQIVPHDFPDAVRNNVLMLMNGAGPRPDALLIADDTLIEPASSGLVAAGVDVPGEIEIVAECNFPWHAPVLPMTRIGFNTDQIMETALGIIDTMRQGQRAPAVTRVAAVIEGAAVKLTS